MKVLPLKKINFYIIYAEEYHSSSTSQRILESNKDGDYREFCDALSVLISVLLLYYYSLLRELERGRKWSNTWENVVVNNINQINYFLSNVERMNVENEVIWIQENQACKKT